MLSRLTRRDGGGSIGSRPNGATAIAAAAGRGSELLQPARDVLRLAIRMLEGGASMRMASMRMLEGMAPALHRRARWITWSPGGRAKDGRNGGVARVAPQRPAGGRRRRLSGRFWCCRDKSLLEEA